MRETVDGKPVMRLQAGHSGERPSQYFVTAAWSTLANKRTSFTGWTMAGRFASQSWPASCVQPGRVS